MTKADDLQAAVGELEDRIRRYPSATYPVQHATAQFHLGVALTQATRLREAEDALLAAARLFDPDRLAVEHGKTLNSLGAVQRMQGRLEDAAATFARAAEIFERSRSEAERGAAVFNLGLVRREQDDPTGAARSFREARSVFDAGRLPIQAAAAARELGGSLLATGDLEAALEHLEEAVTLADGAGDQAGSGASANALGLVHMAAGRLPDAVDSFRAAAAAHPRSVRAHDFAMAKANLALAYERAGDSPRARLAALQALGIEEASPAVRTQASGVIARLGNEPGDLIGVLDQETRDRWPAIVREDLALWADAPPARQRAEWTAWVDGQLARPHTAVDLAETWLGALLELPPASMEGLVRSVIQALAQRTTSDRERFRADVKRAMARFHVPQLMRLEATFNLLASELGPESGW
ncbi:MAG: tetratricopeptide repeat protein [Actinomycetota bacterium]